MAGTLNTLSSSHLPELIQMYKDLENTQEFAALFFLERWIEDPNSLKHVIYKVIALNDD